MPDHIDHNNVIYLVDWLTEMLGHPDAPLDSIYEALHRTKRAISEHRLLAQLDIDITDRDKRDHADTIDTANTTDLCENLAALLAKISQLEPFPQPKEYEIIRVIGKMFEQILAISEDSLPGQKDKLDISQLQQAIAKESEQIELSRRRAGQPEATLPKAALTTLTPR